MNGPVGRSSSTARRDDGHIPTKPADSGFGASIGESAIHDRTAPAGDVSHRPRRAPVAAVIDLCRRVPMLPVVILSAIPVALLWNVRPWGVAPWARGPHRGSLAIDPSIGQWIVVALVAYTVVDTVRGMIDDIRHGQVGVDLLAVMALLSTLAVGEYWASWAVVLMITSGEAIEEYAQSKAEHSLTALLEAAPRTAHVATLPGVGRAGHAGRGNRGVADDGTAAGRVGRSDCVGRVGRADRVDRMTGPGGVSHADAPRPARNIAPIREHDGDGFRHVMTSTYEEPTTHRSDARRTIPGSPRRGELSAQRTEGSRDERNRDVVCALTGRDAGSCDPAVVKADRRVRPGADSRFETVPVDEVRLGDVIIVLPGETVPVDGELLSGSATLDLSAINGEPVPREVYAGARVMSGAVNGSTTLAMRAVEVAADSQYQRILSLVAEAQESRPTVVRTADRLAVPFTVISLVIAGVAWAVAGTPTRFAQVLVLATPCPLLIAAPVAYIAGTGRLAAAGILIKTQDVIESLGRVTRVFFDKTGTLTVKQPQVVRVELAAPSAVSGSAPDTASAVPAAAGTAGTVPAAAGTAGTVPAAAGTADAAGADSDTAGAAPGTVNAAGSTASAEPDTSGAAFGAAGAGAAAGTIGVAGTELDTAGAAPSTAGAVAGAAPAAVSGSAPNIASDSVESDVHTAVEVANTSDSVGTDVNTAVGVINASDSVDSDAIVPVGPVNTSDSVGMDVSTAVDVAYTSDSAESVVNAPSGITKSSDSVGTGTDAPGEAVKTSDSVERVADVSCGTAGMPVARAAGTSEPSDSVVTVVDECVEAVETSDSVGTDVNTTTGVANMSDSANLDAVVPVVPANTSNSVGTAVNTAVEVTNTSDSVGTDVADGDDRQTLDEDHVLMFAGVVESYSVHVLAKGIAAAGRDALDRLHARHDDGRRDRSEVGESGHGRDYPVVTGVHEEPGKGIAAEVDGRAVRVGRLSFAAAGDDGFLATDSAPRTRFGALAPDEMASYVAVDGRLVARIVLRDVPRDNARDTLDRLHGLGVDKLVMLTGDKRASADIIAREVGIDEVHAELFPEDKVAAVRAATRSGRTAGTDGTVGSAGHVGISGDGLLRTAGTDGSEATHATVAGSVGSVGIAGSVETAGTDGTVGTTGTAGIVGTVGTTGTVGTAGTARGTTMMVGDGVNDAPVLAAADIGVAMTDGTSTAASESAQVVIMNDRLDAVPRAIAIARRTRRVMLQAVVLGLALAVIGMIAAAFDLIPVVVGAFLQEAIDVVSILWALTALIDRD